MSDLETLKKQILPVMDNFSKHILIFESKLKQSQEIIRRYDEVISDKASKFELKEIEKVLSEKFCHIAQYRQLDDKID